MNNKTLVAIDVGSGYVKGLTGDSYVAFQSVASKFPEGDFFSASEPDKIVINDVAWIIGESAVNAVKKEDRHNTLMDEWGGSEGWLALLFFAIGALGVSGKIRLVTGLPQAQYADKARRADIIETIKGRHHFKWKDESIHVDIDEVIIIPQAAGAVFYQAGEDESVLSDVVGVLDIGTFTAGLSVMKNGQFSQVRSGGVCTGVSNLIDALALHLEKEYAYKMDLADGPKVLREKKIKNRNQIIDLQGDIKKLAARVSKPIQDAVYSIWDGANDLTVFISGGGAPYFVDALIEVMPHAKVMDNNFYAVVTGMMLYLENLKETE